MKGLFLLLLLAPALGLAQEVREISLRTLCFKRVGNVNELLLLTGPAENPQPVTVPLYSSYSEEIAIKTSRDSLAFALKNPNSSEENVQTTFPIVGEGRFADSKRQVAIFIPSGDEKKPYNVLVLDESSQAFPLGSTFLVNLAPEAIRFTLGEKDLVVQPGKMGNVAKPQKVTAMNQATMRIFIPVKDDPSKWQAVTSTVWRITDNKRSLAIAYQDPKNDRIYVSAHQETPPWERPDLEALMGGQ